MSRQLFIQEAMLIENLIDKIKNDLNKLRIDAENLKLARDIEGSHSHELDCQKAIKAQAQRLVILENIRDGIPISLEELAHLKKIPDLARIDSQISELKVQPNVLKQRIVEVGYGAMVVGFVALSSLVIASAVGLAMYTGIAISVLAVAYCLWACCYLSAGTQNLAPVVSNNFAFDNPKNESTGQFITQLVKEASRAASAPLANSSESEIEDLSTGTPVVKIIGGFPQVGSTEDALRSSSRTPFCFYKEIDNASTGTPVVRVIGGFPSV